MFKFFILFISIVFTFASSSYGNGPEKDSEGDQPSRRLAISYDPFNLFDETSPCLDIASVSKPTLPQIFKNHAFVPDSSGKPQGREAFKLLFAGQEDPTTVRILTQPPMSQYTFMERMKYLFQKERAPISLLTGTITSRGIITNAHGFVEEVPSFQNDILRFIGSKNLHYRTLHPVKAEAGLTVRYFSTGNEDVYHDGNSSLEPYEFVHASYGADQIEAVFLSKGYIVQKEINSEGGFYGTIDPRCDLALIMFRNKHIPVHTTQASVESNSKEKTLKVKIFQYPKGHPLQKVSEEYADFSDNTHRCVTLQGSSGASLRDYGTGQIVGIHRGGIEGVYNVFVPFSEITFEELTKLVYLRENI